MDDLPLMKILEPSHDIFEGIHSPTLPQSLLLLDVSPQIAVLAKLSHNVHVVIGLIDVQQLDNIGMLHFLHDLDLRLNGLDIVSVGEDLLIDDLDSSGYIIGDPPAQVDGGIGSLADDLVEGEDILVNPLFAFLEIDSAWGSNSFQSFVILAIIDAHPRMYEKHDFGQIGDCFFLSRLNVNFNFLLKYLEPFCKIKAHFFALVDVLSQNSIHVLVTVVF